MKNEKKWYLVTYEWFNLKRPKTFQVFEEGMENDHARFDVIKTDNIERWMKLSQELQDSLDVSNRYSGDYYLKYFQDDLDRLHGYENNLEDEIEAIGKYVQPNRFGLYKKN